MSIDLTQQALNALADAGLGDSPAKAPRGLRDRIHPRPQRCARARHPHRTTINATQPTAGEIERLAINLWEHNGERPTVYESGKRIADRELEWWKQVAVSAWSFINGTEKEQ